MLAMGRALMARPRLLLLDEPSLGLAPLITDDIFATIHQLARSGVSRVQVVCPGCAVDCLETLEKIAMQNAELFEESGGGELNYIPSLNAREDHIDLLADLAAAHARGWPEFSGDIDEAEIREEQELMRQRAVAAQTLGKVYRFVDDIPP